MHLAAYRWTRYVRAIYIEWNISVRFQWGRPRLNYNKYIENIWSITTAKLQRKKLNREDWRRNVIGRFDLQPPDWNKKEVYSGYLFKFFSLRMSLWVPPVFSLKKMSELYSTSSRSHSTTTPFLKSLFTSFWIKGWFLGVLILKVLPTVKDFPQIVLASSLEQSESPLGLNWFFPKQ